MVKMVISAGAESSIGRLRVTSRDYVISLPCGKRPHPILCIVCESQVSVEPGMVRSCCAIGCTARDIKETREAGVQFYRIPQNETKRVLWVNAIHRKDWQPSASTVICSQHFVGGKCVVT